MSYFEYMINLQGQSYRYKSHEEVSRAWNKLCDCDRYEQNSMTLKRRLITDNSILESLSDFKGVVILKDKVIMPYEVIAVI